MSADALGLACDRLNAKLTEAESKIAALSIGATGRVLIKSDDAGQHLLSFRKHSDQWRLMYEQQDFEPVPLVNASREIRLLASSLLAALVDQLTKNALAETAAVERAINSVDFFLGRP